MNKAEFIHAMQVKCPEFSKDAIRDVLDAFFDVVKETTTKGETVTFVGFATFETKERAARKGINPKTGEKIDIPAYKNVVCNLSKKWARL